MQNFKLFLFSSFFLSILTFPKNAIAQGIIITKAGDTINYSKIENDYPDTKYWIKGSDTPIIIRLDAIGNQISLPEYILEKNEVDEFTGSLKRFTKIINVGGSKSNSNGYSTNLIVRMGKIVSTDKTVMYVIKMRTPTELGCSGSDKNYAMIKLVNNEVIELKNDISEIDCKKNAVSTYVLLDDVLNKLRKLEVKAIRFRQSENYEDFSVIFPDCLIKTLETLDK